MHELAECLGKTIRKHESMHAGDRVAAAVSGGPDSVALLLLLLELRSELGIVLSVAHVNHKLRGEESDADEQFVANLAARHQLELFTRIAPVDRRLEAGIESTARRLRYEFFRDVARQGRATRIATAHTLDDQAETVLLRILRGTGIRGLGGILPRLRLETEGRACAEVVRPLLNFRRAELRGYLGARAQEWREDSSNQDVAFLRNRVRHRMLPLITDEFGGAATEHLANLAEIARAEEEWVSSQSPQAEAIRNPGTALQPVHGLTASGTLDIGQLVALPLAVARRAVRAWVEQNAPDVSISFRLIEDLLDLARGPAGKKLELPIRCEGVGAELTVPVSGSSGGFFRIVRRSYRELTIEPLNADEARDYEYRLSVPGEIFIPELGARFEAEIVDVASILERNRDYLLDGARLGPELILRNWRAGDRFWPAHTKQERKVKELLSGRHAGGSEKKMWPVAVCQGELVWMRGFAVPQAWQPHSEQAIRIRETSGRS
jgi:tRNA(Ile)-lysidine synthase